MKRRLRGLLACLTLSAATAAGSLLAAGTATASLVPATGHRGQEQVTAPARLPLDRVQPGRLAAAGYPTGAA